MRLWVHKSNTTTGNNGGFVDVLPDIDGEDLVAAGQAQLPQDTPLKPVTPPCTASWDGTGSEVQAEPTPPIVRGDPIIAGQPVVGATFNLTSIGQVRAWPLAIRTYQWFRSGVMIPGATKGWYVTVQADLNRRIQCRVTFTNKLGQAIALSNFIRIRPAP